MDTSSSVTDAGSARDRALVRMFETVNASHWTSAGSLAHGEVDDLQPLLRLMDIGSCASAEKHTGVNCVVSLSSWPRRGERGRPGTRGGGEEKTEHVTRATRNSTTAS